MTTRRPGWMVLSVPWALAAMLAAPRPSAAQCGMMGGGGHDHSAMSRQNSKTSPVSRKKLQHAVDQLLSEDNGRAMLADALLGDREFIEDLLQRIAAVPEWRSLAAAKLVPASGGGAFETARPGPPPAEAALYACPMHPEVTSAKPGDCPRCGMELVRKDSDRP